MVWVTTTTFLWIGNLDPLSLIHVADDLNAFPGLAAGAGDLVVPLVTDQDDPVPLSGEPAYLPVYLFHEWAGSIHQQLQFFFPSLLPHRRRDSVGAEDESRSVGELVDALHEPDTPPGEVFHHAPVVNDLVEDVERGPVLIEGPLHCLHGHFNPGAEASRLG